MLESGLFRCDSNSTEHLDDSRINWERHDTQGSDAGLPIPINHASLLQSRYQSMDLLASRPRCHCHLSFPCLPVSESTRLETHLSIGSSPPGGLHHPTTRLLPRSSAHVLSDRWPIPIRIHLLESDREIENPTKFDSIVLIWKGCLLWLDGSETIDEWLDVEEGEGGSERFEDLIGIASDLLSSRKVEFDASKAHKSERRCIAISRGLRDDEQAGIFILNCGLRFVSWWKEKRADLGFRSWWGLSLNQQKEMKRDRQRELEEGQSMQRWARLRALGGWDQLGNPQFQISLAYSRGSTQKMIDVLIEMDGL